MHAYNFGGEGEQPHQTFTGDVQRGRHDKVGTIFGGTVPLEFRKAKTVQILARFCATSHFDRQYLQNG